ncbi:MAG: hypothetical protein Q9220_006909 [cf. Caloplaca sp. 1 TL-2023]
MENQPDQPVSLAILSRVEETYLSCFAFHVPCLTPWGLALFMRAKVAHCRIQTAGDVCRFLRDLTLGDRKINHGIFGFYGTLHRHVMTEKELLGLQGVLAALPKFLAIDIPVADVDIRIFEPNHNRPTVYDQVKRWNLLSRDGDTTCLQHPRGITLGNRQRHVEEARDYAGRIRELKRDPRLPANTRAFQDEFLSYVALRFRGITAFRVTQAVHLIWVDGGGRVPNTDHETYKNTWRKHRNKDQWFVKVRDYNLHGIDDQKARIYHELFETACKELILNIDTEPRYRPVKDKRAAACTNDLPYLRNWILEDHIGLRTPVEQQTKVRALRFDTENTGQMDRVRQLGPLAQQMVERHHLVAALKCPVCRVIHGKTPCPPRYDLQGQ